jgi:type I restriction enzyme S subunit
VHFQYLKYALGSVIQAAVGLNRGAANPLVTQTDLGRLEIPVPDKTVQKQIAMVLARLDDRIEVNHRINETLEAMAQAIFKSWFVDFDSVKAKIAANVEGGDPLRAAMTAISGKPDAQLDTLPPDQFATLATTAALFPDEMEDSAFGVIPKGWNVGTFKDCCLRVESGGTPSRKEPAFWGGSIPWLTSGEVRDVVVLDTKEKISRAGLDASNAKLWPAMSTVVAMYGATAGQVCLIANEMTANQACCALIPKAAFKSFIFIAARQAVQQLAEKASGSAQQNLNKSLVENHVHVIPDDGVAERFELATTSLLQKWVLNQREAATLAQLRDNLLPKLLSGELQVQSSEMEAAA